MSIRFSSALLLMLAALAPLEGIGAEQPSFTGRRDYLPTSQIFDTVVADVNHDGISDLVLCYGGIVQAFLGDGTGAFAPGPESHILGSPDAMVALDLNGDGIPDLLSTSLSGLYVSFGNGDGTFQFGTFYPGGAQGDPSGNHMTVGDFNNDGVPDAIVVASEGLWFYAGHSDGTFSPGVLAVPLPNAPYGASPITSWDLDGDGNLDVAVGFYYGLTSFGWDAIYGNGDGTFQPPVNYATSERVGGMQAGVLRPGGPPVIILTVSGTTYFATYQANGRSFLAPVYNDLPLGYFTIGDVNNDGLTDIADASGLVAFGAGNRRFPKSITYPVEDAQNTENAAIIADLRNNGRQDIVSVSAEAVSVLLNKGKGSFQDGNWTPVSGGILCAATGDFNGDGKPDIAASTAAGVVILLGTSSTVHPFQTGVTLPVPDAECPQVGDLNKDGISDIAVHNSTGVFAFLGKGDGTFTQSGFTPTSVDCHMILGDFNRDGKLDFATCGNLLAYGNGNGTFQAPQAFVPNPIPAGYSYIAVGDINNDGSPDLVLTNVQEPYADIAVLLNNQHGGFTQSDPGFGNLTNSAILTDLNGDGKLDLVVTSIFDYSEALLYFGDGKGGFTKGPILPSYLWAEAPAYVSVADYNGDGIPDVAVMASRTIAVYPGLGSGTFGTALDWGAGPAPSFLLSADLQGQSAHSGKADLMAADGSGGVLVLFNTTR